MQNDGHGPADRRDTETGRVRCGQSPDGRRVGICRALDGFRYFPLWRDFLAGLGCEVVSSGPTTRQMVEEGARIAPAELCLPVKACIGHALALRGRVDRLLVPRLVCWKGDTGPLYGCPKTIALPDMLKALVPGLPPIVELRVDERERSERRSWLELAGELGAGRGTRQEPPALREGMDTGKNHRDTETDRGGQGQDCRVQIAECRLQNGGDAPVVAVVGHDYLVDDEELSLNLLARLREVGAMLVRAGQGSPDRKGSRVQPEPCPHIRPGFEPDWLFERELIRQALGWAARPEVDGLLLAASFACGTSAVTNDIIRRAVRLARPGLAVLELSFDEQTGPAGLATRVESFVELLKMRGKNHRDTETGRAWCGQDKDRRR